MLQQTSVRTDFLICRFHDMSFFTEAPKSCKNHITRRYRITSVPQPYAKLDSPENGRVGEVSAKLNALVYFVSPQKLVRETI